MEQPKYHLKAEQDLTIFEFVSEGPNGSIPKLIEFTETNLKDFYNLAFGDKDENTGKFDDRVVTNNNDTEKVLVPIHRDCICGISFYRQTPGCLGLCYREYNCPNQALQNGHQQIFCGSRK